MITPPNKTENNKAAPNLISNVKKRRSRFIRVLLREVSKKDEKIINNSIKTKIRLIMRITIK